MKGPELEAWRLETHAEYLSCQKIVQRIVQLRKRMYMHAQEARMPTYAPCDGVHKSPERRSVTALHTAAEWGDVARVVGLEADLHTRAPDGSTALHFAAANAHVEMVKTLVGLGADVNAQTDNGDSALHCAAHLGHEEMVKALVELGAVVHMEKDDGTTALHDAAAEGHAEVVEVLVELGADVNVQDVDGVTPLHEAEDQGHPDVVEVLVWLGAKEDDEHDYLHDAAREGRAEVVPLRVVSARVGKARKVLVPFGTAMEALDKAGWSAQKFATNLGFKALGNVC